MKSGFDPIVRLSRIPVETAPAFQPRPLIVDLMQRFSMIRGTVLRRVLSFCFSGMKPRFEWSCALPAFARKDDVIGG